MNNYSITASPVSPYEPAIGTIYFNTIHNCLYVYSGEQWTFLGNDEDFNRVKNNVLKSKLEILIDGKKEKTT